VSAGAVLVAAGAGARLGADIPKAFVTVAGETLLLRAARTLHESGCFSALVVVVPQEWRAQAAGLLEGADIAAEICAGGRTRQESVARGLARCDQEVIAVHDAARALAPVELVRKTVAALTPDWDAVAPAERLVDTVKRVDPEDGRVVETVNRSVLRAVQTPQVFRRELLLRLHGEAHGGDATDDLLLVEQAGGRVLLIEGARRNLKITTREDLLLAEALLREDARP
jgi:2-C-methyl-D-erythritol 4-phosphate cytidylyltransferase